MRMTQSTAAPERVLIADDEILIRTNLQEMLEGAGYQVVDSCGDGFSAVEGCKKHRPDIALLDIRMPMLDGMAAARFILEQALCPVVILITAYSDLSLVETAKEFGIAGYLVKPVNETILIPTLKVAAARGEELKSLREQVTKSQQALEDRKLIEKAKGLLMAREGLTEQQAFDYIRAVSRRSCTSMRAVAALIAGTPGTK